MLGKVKWWDNSKGFGFITPKDKVEASRDVFCHYSSIIMEGRKKLIEGQAVNFEIEISDRGPRAISVRPL